MIELIAIGGLVALAAMFWPRSASGMMPITDVSGAGSWQWPAGAAPYANAIRAAEERHGMPFGLLARLLYQESRYRADIIDGRTVSAAGAVGIAQIVPRWHPDVNPLDPYASIDYATRYLDELRARFGSWDKALAAYNWGPTRVAEALHAHGADWLASAPRETKAYVAQISADIRGLA